MRINESLIKKLEPKLSILPAKQFYLLSGFPNQFPSAKSYSKPERWKCTGEALGQDFILLKTQICTGILKLWWYTLWSSFSARIDLLIEQHQDGLWSLTSTWPRLEPDTPKRKPWRCSYLPNFSSGSCNKNSLYQNVQCSLGQWETKKNPLFE